MELPHRLQRNLLFLDAILMQVEDVELEYSHRNQRPQLHPTFFGLPIYRVEPTSSLLYPNNTAIPNPYLIDHERVRVLEAVPEAPYSIRLHQLNDHVDWITVTTAVGRYPR
jgi:hypothetical protein